MSKCQGFNEVKIVSDGLNILIYELTIRFQLQNAAMCIEVSSVTSQFVYF